MDMEMLPFIVRRTGVFHDWLQDLKKADRKAYIATQSRIQRLAYGSLEGVRHLGGGVNEMRIEHGHGYRVYFTRRGIVITLHIARWNRAKAERKHRADEAHG